MEDVLKMSKNRVKRTTWGTIIVISVNIVRISIKPVTARIERREGMWQH